MWSGGVDVYAKLEPGVADLVLESQTYELSLVPLECDSEGSGALKANVTSSVFDVAEMRPRDTKKLGELSETLALGLPDGRKSATER